jgi:hypothetical protein
MPIEEKTRFVLNLKLKTEKWQEDIMNPEFLKKLTHTYFPSHFHTQN